MRSKDWRSSFSHLWTKIYPVKGMKLLMKHIYASRPILSKKKKDVMQVVKNCFKMNYDKLFMLHLNVMFYNNAVLCVDKITKNYVFKIRKQNILINGTKFNALTKLVILNNLMWKLWIERKIYGRKRRRRWTLSILRICFIRIRIQLHKISMYAFIVNLIRKLIYVYCLRF